VGLNSPAFDSTQLDTTRYDSIRIIDPQFRACGPDTTISLLCDTPLRNDADTPLHHDTSLRHDTLLRHDAMMRDDSDTPR
jgi:hypothetical protein